MFPLTRRSVLLGGVAAGLATSVMAQDIGKVPDAPKPDTEGNAASKDPLPSQVAVPVDPAITALVDQVSVDRLRSHVDALSAFPTRLTDGSDFPQVEAWVEHAFVTNGADANSVTRQAYTLPSGVTRNNILCGDPHSARGIILIGAHIDSTSEQPETLAPGANDNASGVAAMLEAKRILSQVALNKDIVCIAFSGEEQDLLGSTACSEIARREGWRIDLMINLDMLGYDSGDPAAALIIEYDQGNEAAANDSLAEGFAIMSAQMAATYTTLNVSHTDIWDSDYMAFEAAGFTCIGFYDGGVDSAEYHTTSDTADRLSYDRLAQATRLLVATAVTAAGLTA